jgi:hypothetical protein
MTGSRSYSVSSVTRRCSRPVGTRDLQTTRCSKCFVYRKGAGDKLATRFQATNPSEVAGLVVGPPGLEPGTRAKSASNFSYLQDRFCASDKRATNGG